MPETRKIEIKTDFIKLDQLLKYSGLIITGGSAKDAVIGGAVLVNGMPCLMRGKKIRSGDTIFYDGVTIEVTGP